MSLSKRMFLAFVSCLIGVFVGLFAETRTEASWASGLGIPLAGIAVLLLAWKGKGQVATVWLLMTAGTVASVGTLLTGDPNALEAAFWLLVDLVVVLAEVIAAIALFCWGVIVWVGLWYWLLLGALAVAYIRLRRNWRRN